MRLKKNTLYLRWLRSRGKLVVAIVVALFIAVFGVVFLILLVSTRVRSNRWSLRVVVERDRDF